MSDQKSNRTKVILEVLAVLAAIVGLATAIVSNLDKFTPAEPQEEHYPPVVSAGVKTPNLTGQPLDLAQGTLLDKKLSLGRIKWVTERTAKDGIVISQSPEYQTEVEPGSQIDLVVTQVVNHQDPAVENPEITGRIEFLNAKIHSLTFFEMPYGGTVRADRVYRDKFKRFETRYVGVQLNLTHSPPADTLHFSLNVVFKNPKGITMGFASKNTYLPTGWIWSSHDVQSWGWREPGHWREGKYTVEITCRNEVVAKGTFEIE